MAPVLEKQLPGAAGLGDSNKEEEEGQTLWQVALSFNGFVSAQTAVKVAKPRRRCFVTAGCSLSNTGPASFVAVMLAAVAAELNLNANGEANAS